MSGSSVMLIVIAVLVVIAAPVAVYFILRYMRGSIRVTLPRTAFNPGEKVSGSFQLKVRKNIEGNRLYTVLIGQEVTKVRQGDSTRTQTREVYRSEVTLETVRAFSAGETHRYDFEIAAPTAQEPEFLNSPLGQSLKAGLELLGGQRRYLRWRIEVRLDAKGIDLASSRRISINTQALV